MPMDDAQSDEQLLQRARTAGDRAAFDTLIRRYANLVYGIAMRQTRDAQLAADISQAVFIVFVKRILSIHQARALPGWFLKTTRFAVRDARRSADRRRFHEHQAAASRTEQAMSQNNPDQAAELAVIDDAIASLGRTDRDLLLMRYLQGRDFAVIAATLGITEPAVRKRLARAIERMRGFFNANGAALSVVSVTGLLGSATTIVAPAAVVEGSVVAATAGGVASTSAVAMIAKGVIQIMSWTNGKIAGGIVVVILAVGAGGVGVKKIMRHKSPAVATTAPGVVAAAEPAAMTQDEAIAELNQSYALASNEVLRLIKPPFSRARAVWVDAEYEEARGSDRVHSIGFRWTADGSLNESYMMYPDMLLRGLIDLVVGLNWYEVEGLDRVQWGPIHGDFVVRESATEEERLRALLKLVQSQTGAGLSITKETRSRACIVLYGSLGTPPGRVDVLEFQRTAESLNAPFLLEDGRSRRRPVLTIPLGKRVNMPKDKLDSADPDYLRKLQDAVRRVQIELGGDWRVEQRDVEVFVIESHEAVGP